MLLFSLLLHLHELVLVVQQLHVLIEEAFGLEVELLLNLHVQGVDFHLQSANDGVLIQLVVESESD